MLKPRRIVFLLYPGFELLDLAGPSSVFKTANQLSQQVLYEICHISSVSAALQSDCGLSLQARSCYEFAYHKHDTVLVMGAPEPHLRIAMRDQDLRQHLQALVPHVERYGSVCSGSFLLARAGLLAQKQATTHWLATQKLQQAYPACDVLADALYVQDQQLWTSAGVSTGIDMALEMLKRDHGAALSQRVARQLVLYAHRPGHQSQFSQLLEVQGAAQGEFADLVSWLVSQLSHPVKVADMAQRVSMSERNFLRKFQAATQTTPAKFFEQLRLEHARHLLEQGYAIKQVCAQVGYRAESAFRCAFFARYGVNPGHVQEMAGSTLKQNTQTE